MSAFKGTRPRNAGKTLLLLCRTLYGDVSETTCEQNTEQQPTDDSMKTDNDTCYQLKGYCGNTTTNFISYETLVFHVFNIANVAF
jgi:hypothetical protein